MEEHGKARAMIDPARVRYGDRISSRDNYASVRVVQKVLFNLLLMISTGNLKSKKNDIKKFSTVII